LGRSKNGTESKGAKRQSAISPQNQKPKDPPSWAALSLEQRTFLTTYSADRTVSAGARAAGIARNTFYNWLNASTEFAAAFDELEREILDQARKAWVQWFPADWKAAAEYLKKYDRPNEYKPDKQVIVVRGGARPERLGDE